MAQETSRLSISFFEETEACVNTAKEKYFPNKSKAEIVRQLVAEGYKALERRDKRK